MNSMPRFFVINAGPWTQPSPIAITETHSLKEGGVRIKEEPDDDYPESKSKISSALRYSMITANPPLPEFSEVVKSHLLDNDLCPVWSAFIDECAHFYYNKYPNIQTSSEYQAIGRKMYTVYPTIGYEGKEPWSYFCKSLSQKIRHIKWKVKRKKMGPLRPLYRRKPKEPKYTLQLGSIKQKVDRRFTTSKLYKALLKELAEGWSNNTITESRIVTIINDTLKGRRTWLAFHTHRRLFSLMEEYPCFSDGRYIVQDFLHLADKMGEGLADMTQKLDSLFETVGGLMEPPVENNGFLSQVQLLRYIEEQVAPSRMRNALAKSIIVHKINVPDAEMFQQVQTMENSSPLLFVFSDGKNILKTLVAGDKTIINANATSLTDALIVLIATYFTFALDYPKTFAQILGFLQTFVVGEPYEEYRTHRYYAFARKVSAILDSKDE